MLQAYADADLLVLLSHRENFGMVVAEAMAAGVPVLISDQVGLAEEVKQANAGCVVSSEDEEIAAHMDADAGFTRPAPDGITRAELGRRTLCV